MLEKNTVDFIKQVFEIVTDTPQHTRSQLS
jgi:protein gp37